MHSKLRELKVNEDKIRVKVAGFQGVSLQLRVNLSGEAIEKLNALNVMLTYDTYV